MSSSLKERIISALCVGLMFFMILCVMNKLISYREDWLPYSAMWACSWAIGHFIGKTMEVEESILKRLLYEAIILFIVSLILAFVIGVLIELSSWKYILTNTCAPFGISMLINNKWIKD